MKLCLPYKFDEVGAFQLGGGVAVFVATRAGSH